MIFEYFRFGIRRSILPLRNYEKISRMSRLQGQLRLIVSCGLGVFFVAESMNPNFWRPHIESLAPFVHWSIGLFGLMWFVQAIAIHRQLRKQ